MKILFTKTGIKKEISEKLGSNFDAFFMDFIKIELKHFNKTILRKDFEENSTLIFTSKNAVKSFLYNDLRFKENQKIVCVGSKTKTLVEKNGGTVSIYENNAENLAENLLKEEGNKKYLHFCGNLVLDTLEKSLKNYQKIEVYETQLLSPKISKNYDAVVFFSPSSVRSFATQNSLEGKMIFSIGKTTSEEIKNFTKSEVFTSDKNNLEDLLNLIVQCNMY